MPITETNTETPEKQTSDGDLLAHIVREAEMLESFVAGTPLEALCGKLWIPSREGSGLEVCSGCRKMAEEYMGGVDYGATRKE